MHGFDMYSFSPFDVGSSLAQAFACALLQKQAAAFKPFG